MTDKQKWQKIREILEAAAGLSGEERRRFLDREYGGDPELRREVEKLLSSFEEADTSLLEEPAERKSVSQLDDQKTQTLNYQTADEFHPDTFVSGMVLDNRYRIIGLLGKGGMGEVYKADDLRLEQTVALKFLPDELSRNEDALKRFIGEVKTARQVAHENVCKVFDIGEIGGKSYLSMEYIEGDDLSQLLRRVGRLSSERAVEISRQICLGLNAIHKAGILHRDLKPANIIIDSKGAAKITDFGIAGLEKDVQGAESHVGTPAYMSPEQITGKEVTKKSDLYSLGLVLYEIFTGEQAVKGESFNELIKKHKTTIPANPSTIVESIDPLIEKIIKRCLEKQPEDRPKSALQVALALPGGNPLEAAIAAGETPSPEMIAAVPKKGALKPSVALFLLFAVIGGVLLTAVYHQYYRVQNIVPFEKPPEALADRAKTIIRDLGYADPPLDVKYRMRQSRDFITYALNDENNVTDPERFVRSGDAVMFYFLYRQSPRHLNPLGWRIVTENDPPLLLSGMINVKLDTRGRLIDFIAVPDQVIKQTTGQPQETDWKKLFDAAGLEMDEFRETKPEWTVEVHSDERKAWQGSSPNFGEIPLRVEAASYQGKPVRFYLRYPWHRPEREASPIDNRFYEIGDILYSIVFALLIIGAAFLARYNIKNGRDDLKGALKLTIFIFAALCLMGLTDMQLISSLDGARNIFYQILTMAMFNSVIAGLFYIALEPYARRYWSELLISWNRLLAGDVRDPMIGRDILIGLSAGIGVNILTYKLEYLLIDSATRLDAYTQVDVLNGWSAVISELVGNIAFSTQEALSILFLLVTMFVVSGKRNISIALTFLVVSAYSFSFALSDATAAVLFEFLLVFMIFIILVRFGLLAYIFYLFGIKVTWGTPFTLDPANILFTSTVIVFVMLGGLAIYGFYTSIAGRSVFSRGLLDEGR